MQKEEGRDARHTEIPFVLKTTIKIVAKRNNKSNNNDHDGNTFET